MNPSLKRPGGQTARRGLGALYLEQQGLKRFPGFKGRPRQVPD